MWAIIHLQKRSLAGMVAGGHIRRGSPGYRHLQVARGGKVATRLPLRVTSNRVEIDATDAAMTAPGQRSGQAGDRRSAKTIAQGSASTPARLRVQCRHAAPPSIFLHQTGNTYVLAGGRVYDNPMPEPDTQIRKHGIFSKQWKRGPLLLGLGGQGFWVCAKTSHAKASEP